MRRIFVATSNPGKIRDYAAAAEPLGVEIAPVPNFASLPRAREDAPTFEANACKKAEHYSRGINDAYVLADDSGLEVDALGGAPGVRSARYAADAPGAVPDSTGAAAGTTAQERKDAANNARLLVEMRDVPDDRRTGRFVCVIAVARGGRLVACFRGEASGVLLRELRGSGGFGYDPLFYMPALERTFAELTPEQKANYSHRGLAFRKFLKWFQSLEAQESTAPERTQQRM